MAELTITTTQTPKRNYKTTALMAGAGAVAGAASRYIIPTQKEFSSIFNKENADKFISSTANAARANNRSILKYGAIGALIAGGISLIANTFKSDKKVQEEKTTEYIKYNAILDASDYACMVMWYGD